MNITTLAATHAVDAARLHVAGQPGTFLTRLGPEVLTVFYRALPQSATGFGFVLDVPGTEAQPPTVVGFVAATTSTGRLFLELGTRYLRHFLPPLLRCYGRRPALIGQSLQTLCYPFFAHSQTVATQQPAAPAAELLAIMVEPAYRSQGMGTQLIEELVRACQVRQIAALKVTVDGRNEGARRFYARHGFVEEHAFPLYGREMCQYQRSVAPVQATQGQAIVPEAHNQ
jgi:ribosomal protein S18 acetylase RimI-like enzyme